MLVKKIIFGFFISLLGATAVQANDYPTKETIHYALNCMTELGGQTDENLYTCICRYDAIRNAMSFSDYEEGITFERNTPMPGEKGSFFRDNERGEKFYKKLVDVRENANKSCIVVKRVELVKPTKTQ